MIHLPTLQKNQPGNREMTILKICLLALFLFIPAVSLPELFAQVLKSDYARAEGFLGWNIEKLVYYDQVNPEWFGDDLFWYRIHAPEGFVFILVHPHSNTKQPAFDHVKLAAALSEATGKAYEPYNLPFKKIEFVDSGKTVQFWLKDDERWRFEISTSRLTGPEKAAKSAVDEIVSPNGKWTAFERDENLWIRSLETGERIQLSQDGEKDFGYAVFPEGCHRVVTNRRKGTKEKPVLLWSPDSKKIATYKLDERNVEPLCLIETRLGRPILHTYRYALPGDPVVPTYKIHIFDIESRKKIEVQKEAQPMVNTSCCSIVSRDKWKDAQWGADSKEFYFTFGQRDFKRFDLIVANAETGQTRTIIEEQGSTFVEFNPASGGLPNWRVASRAKELIWFSERSGWGHLYLYDLLTGKIKNPITSGPWIVLDIKRLDEENRWIYFSAVGRERDLDPYFRQLYRAKFDGSKIERITQEPTDHDLFVSPSGNFFVDSYSAPETPTITVLRGEDGKVISVLEKADISKLADIGWTFPKSFSVKARDGITELYGFIYFPSDFDNSKSYPIIDYIYPGPQSGPIGYRRFTVGSRSNLQALAELGFIVIHLDAMGTPLRSKAFHDIYYGNMGDNGIIDHILAIKQLARRYPQIDIEKAGIFGHSGGGFSAAGAILRFPDFFKVAVSSAGNHDQRSYDNTWGEKYHGLMKKNQDGTDNFDSQATHLLAKNLKGKILLMYGTLDDNVHPNSTLLLIDELIRQNKNFDLLVLPNRNHVFANEPYVIRRTWDYFVQHLLGCEPPQDFMIEKPAEDLGSY